MFNNQGSKELKKYYNDLKDKFIILLIFIYILIIYLLYII